MLVEWGRPSSTCRRALILPGVRENEGHSRPRRERRARTPDRICLDIDNERRPRSSAMPLLPSAWGRQSALLLSPPTVLFHFFCLHCPLYAASKQSREDLAFFNAMRFFCLKKAQAKQEFVFLNTIFLLKRNQSSNQSSRQQGHQEGKAATAAAAKAAAAKAAGGEKGGPAAAGLGHCVALAQ